MLYLHRGSTTRLRLRDCYTGDEIKALVADIKRAAKRDKTIKKFLAEQLFGKAAQPISGDPVDRPPIPIMHVSRNDTDRKGKRAPLLARTTLTKRRSSFSCGAVVASEGVHPLDT